MTGNGLTDAFLGGWQLSTTYQYQSGAPLVWGTSLYYSESCGNPLDLRSNIGEKVTGGIAGLDVPAWDINCFYFNDAPVQCERRRQPGAAACRYPDQSGNSNNLRYFPSTLPHVRTDDVHLLDVGLSKNFTLPHSMRLQLRLEAINALNYTVLWAPAAESDQTRPSVGSRPTATARATSKSGCGSRSERCTGTWGTTGAL
jgi:hypothetical protein